MFQAGRCKVEALVTLTPYSLDEGNDHRSGVIVLDPMAAPLLRPGCGAVPVLSEHFH